MRQLAIKYIDTVPIMGAGKVYSTGWLNAGFEWFRYDQLFLSLDVSQNCNMKVLQSDDGTNDNKFFMPLFGAKGLDIGANVDLTPGKYTIRLTPTAQFIKIKVTNGAAQMNDFSIRAVCFGE